MTRVKLGGNPPSHCLTPKDTTPSKTNFPLIIAVTPEPLSPISRNNSDLKSFQHSKL